MFKKRMKTRIFIPFTEMERENAADVDAWVRKWMTLMQFKEQENHKWENCSFFEGCNTIEYQVKENGDLEMFICKGHPGHERPLSDGSPSKAMVQYLPYLFRYLQGDKKKQATVNRYFIEDSYAVDADTPLG